MSVTVVGSVALDDVETPHGRNVDGLGGAATYFAIAAANFTQVNMVAIVGEDFPPQHIELFKKKGINLDGLERAQGKTFRWAGRYHANLNDRDTLDTQLNVFEHFHPKLPTSLRSSVLVSGNIHPGLQLEVLEQAKPKFIGLDTMNLWIDSALDDLKKVLARVDAIIINDSEVKLLTGESNLIRGAKAVQAMGPRIVVLKKGEHGCLLLTEEPHLLRPRIPVGRGLRFPTGAGDTFAGGFMGYLASQGKTDADTLRRAVVYGSVAASFTCEKFGPDRLIEIGSNDIEARFGEFKALAAF